MFSEWRFYFTLYQVIYWPTLFYQNNSLRSVFWSPFYKWENEHYRHQGRTASNGRGGLKSMTNSRCTTQYITRSFRAPCILSHYFLIIDGNIIYGSLFSQLSFLLWIFATISYCWEHSVMAIKMLLDSLSHLTCEKLVFNFSYHFIK